MSMIGIGTARECVGRALLPVHVAVSLRRRLSPVQVVVMLVVVRVSVLVVQRLVPMLVGAMPES
ncbi:MAG: hypothetical protein DHS20C15_03940 [Planctomycetota bacterium]|nr:MAG: hypothetical protein DHS20C15_03940 [Planctomycetota bacterium]